MATNNGKPRRSSDTPPLLDAHRDNDFRTDWEPLPPLSLRTKTTLWAIAVILMLVMFANLSTAP